MATARPTSKTPPASARRRASKTPTPAARRTRRAAHTASPQRKASALVWVATQVQPAPHRRFLRYASLLGVAVLLASAAAIGGTAQGDGNSGTIKVHDGASVDPPTRNEPHVAGDAFVEGFNMAAEEGTLNIYSWPPTGDRELVFAGTWQADDGEPVNHFLAGPFELPCGHYRAEAQNGLEENDFPGGVKSKMFWVDCPPAEEPPCGEPGGEPCPPPPCGEPGGEPCPPPPCGEPGGEPCPPCGEPGEEPCPPVPCGEPGGEPCPPCGEPGGEPCPPIPCGEPGGEPCPVEMTCPTDLAASPQSDGSILLSFTPAEGSDGTNVYRLEGETYEYLATVGPDATEYLDDTTVVGHGYTYTVTGLFGDAESTGCPAEVETTAIPEFPTGMAFGLATGGGLLALVLGRRRKA